MSQEQLMTYIDAAFTFYERVTGHIPSTLHIQQLLEVAHIRESRDRIKLCGDIVLDLRNKTVLDVQLHVEDVEAK